MTVSELLGKVFTLTSNVERLNEETKATALQAMENRERIVKLETSLENGLDINKELINEIVKRTTLETIMDINHSLMEEIKQLRLKVSNLEAADRNLKLIKNDTPKLEKGE